MASWSERESGGGYSGPSSTTDSASGSGRDGASLSASSCSSLLGPEAALELLPCAALVFSTQGQLMGVNSKAAELHGSGARAQGPGARRKARRPTARDARGAPAPRWSTGAVLRRAWRRCSHARTSQAALTRPRPRSRAPTRARPAPPLAALWNGAPLNAFTAGAELRNGRKLAPDQLLNQVLESIVLQ
jgi:hypothetical protein